ncbi:MAG: FecR domain-containing protein [Alphaproteobacteria bacterium]|nr:FecR domain-containing protein [Alphaproteobacteria bacterium]
MEIDGLTSARTRVGAGGAGIMRRKLIGTLFAIIGLMLWADAAPAAMPAGTVLAVSGSCTDQGRVLKRGDAVQVGDTVNVPAGGHLQLGMADGSVISVAPDSSVTVASYNLASTARYVRLSLTQGLLRAHVTWVRGPSTFQVTTAVGTASVRSDSADWFANAQSGSAQVGVLDGTVDLTSAVTRQSVSIPSHWGTRNEAGLDPVLPRRWARREFIRVMRLTEFCQLGQSKVETARSCLGA